MAIYFRATPSFHHECLAHDARDSRRKGNPSLDICWGIWFLGEYPTVVWC